MNALKPTDAAEPKNAYGIKEHVPEPESEVAERLAAADLVLRARRVKDLRPRLTMKQRREHALEMEKLAIVLNKAAEHLRAPETDHTWVPPFIRKVTAIRLLRDEDARFHD